MDVTSAREGEARNNRRDAITMAANLFVSTSVIKKKSNQPSQKRSLIFGGQDC